MPDPTKKWMLTQKIKWLPKRKRPFTLIKTVAGLTLTNSSMVDHWSLTLKSSSGGMEESNYCKEKKKFPFVSNTNWFCKKSSLGVISSAFHQKWQVAGSSLEINLSNKLGLRLPTMTPLRLRKSGSFVH